MKEINFKKYTGAGNDFILIDRRNNEDLNLQTEAIQMLCDRRFGVGADGVLLISPDDRHNFDMEYFNADGTGGMLCGNGARCALHHAYRTGLADLPITSFTCSGYEYSGGKIDEEIFKFKLNKPKFIHDEFTVKILGRELKGFYVYTGANHFVIDFESVLNKFKLNDVPFERFNVELFGKEIRKSDQFNPEGTNVNFVYRSNNKNFIRTFEKGVEGETLACGTGASAAALFLNSKFNVPSPVNLITKTGIVLTVSFERNNNEFSDIWLSGPAKKVFEGIYKL
jgi:diaminopimelate epimerase